VPFGTLAHCSAGEMPVEMFRGPLGGGVVAEQVYFVGIVVKSGNDELEISSDGGGAGGGAVAGACCAVADRAGTINDIAETTSRRTIEVLIRFSLPCSLQRNRLPSQTIYRSEFARSSSTRRPLSSARHAARGALGTAFRRNFKQRALLRVSLALEKPLPSGRGVPHPVPSITEPSGARNSLGCSSVIGCFAASASSTSIPQPGFSLIHA